MVCFPFFISNDSRKKDSIMRLQEKGNRFVAANKDITNSEKAKQNIALSSFLNPD